MMGGSQDLSSEYTALQDHTCLAEVANFWCFRWRSDDANAHKILWTTHIMSRMNWVVTANKVRRRQHWPANWKPSTQSKILYLNWIEKFIRYVPKDGLSIHSLRSSSFCLTSKLHKLLYNLGITPNPPQNISCASKQLQWIGQMSDYKYRSKLKLDKESKNYLVLVSSTIFWDCSWEDSFLITPWDMDIDGSNLQ